MILATTRGNKAVEERGSVGGSWPNGFGYTDFSAIPPPGLGDMQRAGVLVTPHTMLQVDVVFTCLRIISNNMIKLGDPRCYTEKLSKDNIPYRVWQSKQPEILTNTWGGRMMQCTGMDRTVWSMALFGEAFWYTLARTKPEAYPAALEVLHPAYMEIKVASPQDVLAGRAQNIGDSMYIYGAGTDKKLLDPDDLTHIPLKSLPGARRGLNPVEYAGIAAALAMAAYEFGSTWFSQGASPSFIFTTDQKLGQAEVERIADKFVVQNSGLDRAHRPLVLDSGLKPDKVMVSPDESQYLNTLEYARSVVFSWFGVEFANQNALQRITPPAPGGMQEESMRFLQHTLSGYLVPLEEAFSGLLPKAKKAAFEEGKLSRPNAAALSEEITALRGSQVGSINDIRTRKLGWAPVEGGDDVIAPLASNTAPSQTAGKSNENAEHDEDDEREPDGKQ